MTGRFDFLVTIKSRSLEELHNVVSSKMGNITGVQHTETFIAMRTGVKPPSYASPD